MVNPDDIVALALAEESYAREVFPRLISLPAAEFHRAIEQDVRTHTESMARLILQHYDRLWNSLAPEHAIQLLQAARLAGARATAHVRCRIEKDIANVHRYLNELEAAEEALSRAQLFAQQTMSPDLHAAIVSFGWMALRFDQGRSDEAMILAEKTIAAFESVGSLDRAFRVTLYLANMQERKGDFLATLAAYSEAARLAQQAGSAQELAHAHWNIGHAYRSLQEHTTARRHFLKAETIFRSLGSAAAAAQAARCVARMTIAIRGEAGVDAMSRPKMMFIELDCAGEACRCIVGIMEELLKIDATMDLSTYCRQLAEEALTLGVMPVAAEVISRLSEAASRRTITTDLLEDAWHAFGPTCVYTPISAVWTVNN